MKVYNESARELWTEIVTRPAMNPRELFDKVQPVLTAVKLRGDEALREFTRQYDGVVLQNLQVSEAEWEAAHTLPEELKDAIRTAAANISAFHEAQRSSPRVIETMPGVSCWRQEAGIERVGLYVPGGTAPLFSTVLMLGLPARIAGCREIVLCTPPGRDGTVHPAILFAASLAGIRQVYKVGGAQAIAAMAYGTETIPQVYKIFGPGNQYVMAAKQLVQLEGVAIDMPAGPSEVCVWADDSANPAFVAADLLSQAEHGTDSQVLLVASSLSLVEAVQAALEAQLAELPRRDIAEAALRQSRAVVLADDLEALALVNAYAAEHLIISRDDADGLAPLITQAGSIFLGHYSPESAGDYASGTNHTLPTNAFARMYSGVSLDSFVKKITVQRLTPEGLRCIAPAVTAMARAEGLEAHAAAVQVRLQTRNPIT